MDYFIKILSNKPKEDINAIVEKMGYVNIAPLCIGKSGFSHFMLKLGAMFRILWKMRRGDHLLIQYPMKKFVSPATWCAHLKGGKVTVLIHDLGCFRRKKLTVKHEMRRMNRVDYIIAHNPSMKRFMEVNGCKTTISCLGIFDYLSDSKTSVYVTPHHPWKVVYAGGLGFRRNPFLYHLDSHINGWQLELYGKHFEESASQGWKHISYKGLLPPDDLIAIVEADFGLVWDGDSLEECSGDWGEYLMFNNPHKTSFYLRANIPVIIWSKAALAPFVLEHGIGIVVDTLEEINSVLSSLSTEDYGKLRANAEEMSKKLNTGYFTQHALKVSSSALFS